MTPLFEREVASSVALRDCRVNVCPRRRGCFGVLGFDIHRARWTLLLAATLDDISHVRLSRHRGTRTQPIDSRAMIVSNFSANPENDALVHSLFTRGILC